MLQSAMVEVFTTQKSASATNQRFNADVERSFSLINTTCMKVKNSWLVGHI